jgi:arylsulfatase A-like enzyme
MGKFLGSPWPYLVGALLLVALYAGGYFANRDADPRPIAGPQALATLAERDDLNVLFILIDTLRAHRLGAYGYERETSPHLDRLAANGIRFARQLSQSSWTKCSMASLWTGLYPVRSGVVRYGHALPEEALLPAEIFREAGYRTAALWRNGWVAPNFGFGQGFELYMRPKPLPVPASVRRENPSIRLEGSDGDIFYSAREFLRQHGNERWFLYLHMMDVHQFVYDEESALFGSGYSDVYDNSIRFVDRVIGYLLAELDERGLRDRTLVVVASDHGEAFGEHGREGHARDIYGEVTEVPFIVSPPFRLDPGIVVETPSANVDIWPTLLDLLDLPPLEDPDGRSFLPEILAAADGASDRGAETSRFAYLDLTWGRTNREPHPLVSVSSGPYRFFHQPTQPESSELYDHDADPTEQHDIAAEQPEIAARLREEAEAHLESDPAPWGDASVVELDDMMLNQLRALGYKIE